MAKRFFIEITDLEKNKTHVSEFNQSKVFNSIEACQKFLDDNFIVDKNNSIVNHWEIDQVSDNKTINKKSYFDTNKKRAIKLQDGIDLYFPLNNQNSVSNWIARIGSGSSVPDKLKNKYIVLKDNKALVDWADSIICKLRPEAVLRLYALRSKYPAVENQKNDNAIRSLDNLDLIWGDQKEFTEHRFFIEGKKGIEIFETKPNEGWLVKSMLTWKELKTVCKIHGVSNKNPVKNITIPAIINGKLVNSIKQRAFKGCSFLEKITLPNSVTSIGDWTFHGCTALKTVVLPDSITSVRKGVFEDCTSLKTITLPKLITSIENWAFGNCTSLETIVLPDSVTSIGYEAFENCASLKKITLPNFITSIEDFVFYNCASLETIVFSDSITSIGNWAFGNCYLLKTIILPDSITSIGKSAFRNCTFLKTITLPDSITSIGTSAFENCSSLKTIILPNSVTSIENWTFGNCSSLETIVLPKFITSIGKSAFKGCTSLKIITLPDPVTFIGDFAFEGCTSLKKTTLPDSITSIGKGVFEDCPALVNRIVIK